MVRRWRLFAYFLYNPHWRLTSPGGTQATSGTKRDVQIATGETLLPESTSRIVLAEACVQALLLTCTENRAYELGTTEGPGPEDDEARWEALYTAANQ